MQEIQYQATVHLKYLPVTNKEITVKSKLIIILISLLILPNCYSQELDDFDIYYINGMFTNEDVNAVINRKEIENTIKNATNNSNIDVKLLYNKDHDWKKQLLDVFVEKNGEVDQELSTFEFWKMMLIPSNRTERFSAILNQYAYENRHKEVGPYSQVDLANMISTVKTSLNSGKKVLLIPHSQGNFFYKNIFLYLEDYDQNLATSCTASVGLASPLSNNYGNYNWVNNSNDFVIESIRAFYPNTLISNITIPKDISFANGDRQGHGIKESYLASSNSIDKFNTLFDSASSQLNATCLGCTDSDMAIWVANDNNAKDDNFNLSINNKHLKGLNLGTDECNGHFILPSKYNGYDKNDIKFHKDVTSSIGGCLPSWKTDSSSSISFSSNVPLTKASSSYAINMDNTQNNNNGNYGTIYSFQMCINPANNKPVARRVLSSASYSGSSGSDIGPFSFNTGQCLPCDDLDNLGAFPANTRRLTAKVSGQGSCSAKVYVDGVYKLYVSATTNGYDTYLKVSPGVRSVEMKNFSSGCSLGTSGNYVNTSLYLGNTKLGGVGFLQTEDSIIVPAIDADNTP